MNRPNVLWIMTDQHWYEALGYADATPVQTPNIDRLADRGVRFDETYCPSPVCGPSRAALFSGTYPQQNGVDGNWERFGEDVDLLPELLSESGYETALVGKLHFVPTHSAHSFDHVRHHDSMNELYYPEKPWYSDYVEWLANRTYDGNVRALVDKANADEAAYREGDLTRFLLGSDWRTEEEHSNTWIADESIAYLRKHRDRNSPFFLFTSFFGPHQPMLAPGKWGDRYDPEEISLPPEYESTKADKPLVQAHEANEGSVFEHLKRYWHDEAQYREILAAYYGQVEMIDHCIGRILDELDDQGLADDTMVAFTADHGDHAGQFGWFFKGTMYEHSARVPLVVRDPDYGDSGTVVDRVVNNIALFRTVLERCGIPVPNNVASRSLLPLMDDPEHDDWMDETYSECGDKRMVARAEYKFVTGSDERNNPVWELYDRTTDVDDVRNLWDHPNHREVGIELREALESWASPADRVDELEDTG